MAREENKSVGPKKETGLRHPLGDPNKETNLRHPIGEPVIRENRRKTDKEKIYEYVSNIWKNVLPKHNLVKVLDNIDNILSGSFYIYGKPENKKQNQS